MSQYPPPMQPVGYGFQPARRRTSGAAITSLVLGIIGCVPFLTGLLAVIFGFMGLRKTRDPNVGGKGLAIAGIILGIVSIIGWTGFGAFTYYAYVQSKPARAVA